MDRRSLDGGMGVFAKSFEQGTSRKDHEIEVKFSTDVLGLNSAMVSPLFASASPPKKQKLRTIYFEFIVWRSQKQWLHPPDSQKWPGGPGTWGQIGEQHG